MLATQLIGLLLPLLQWIAQTTGGGMSAIDDRNDIHIVLDLAVHQIHHALHNWSNAHTSTVLYETTSADYCGIISSTISHICTIWI